MNKSSVFKSPWEPIILTLFVLLAMVSRFVLPPFLGHPENFSPIDAIALFSGAYMGRKWIAFLLPLLSVWISDLMINYQYFHHWVWFYPGFFWQYGFYLAVVWGSSYVLNKPNRMQGLKIPFSSLLVSIAFFLVSNFGVWTGKFPYPHTFSGLMLCYTAGIPFLSSTLFSDLIYTCVLFYGFEWVRSLSTKASLGIPS
jgi:hypothetical protein